MKIDAKASQWHLIFNILHSRKNWQVLLDFAIVKATPESNLEYLTDFPGQVN